MENKLSIYFLVCKGLSIDDVGALRHTVVSGDMTGSWFRNRSFRHKEASGGYRTTTPAEHLDPKCMTQGPPDAFCEPKARFTVASPVFLQENRRF